MQLYSTLQRQKLPFEPLDPAEVKMYCCGPTVYNYAHIGNLRTYIFEDLLRRALEFEGFQVKHVMNITDVGHLTSDADTGEDKMLKGAKREKKTVWQIADFYAEAFMNDMKALNLLHPTIICKATDHIKEIIAQIQKLEVNGLTYQAGGNVYFDTSKLPDYGKLAQLDKQKLEAGPSERHGRAGARIEVDKNKKNPHDFVLWFTKSKFKDQEMRWDSPWSHGYPGWHIECSAMSIKYLGEQFDIHCGGIDHIPVHHTNELAQSEGATNKRPWVLYWCHGNFLTLGKKEKMAKSADNFLRIQTLIDKGFSPLDYRYFCLQSHYRKELTFSWKAMDAAKTGLSRLRAKVAEFGPKEGAIHESWLKKFSEAIADDLNLPQALAVAWEVVEDEKLWKEDKSATILKFDEVLGLKLDEPVEFTVPPKVQKLIIERDAARKAKDWKKSDDLRAQIEKLGFIVKDTPTGINVKPK